MTLIRRMNADEHDEMLDQRWSCARCSLLPTYRVVGPGAFRLCDEHAEETRRNLEAR